METGLSMKLKRVACAATLAAGIGAASLFGVGLSVAYADPGWNCGGQNGPGCQGPGPWNNQWNNNNGPIPQGNDEWRHRGIDQARQDHQAFMWNNQQVQPIPAGDGNGWGFWFLGQWIPL
jgi:hypothetical protein